MTGQLDGLRKAVRAWYTEELQRVGTAFEDSGDLDGLDFEELIRRAQVLFACELTELVEEQQDGPLPADSPDRGQLERVAQAMRARGLQVPDSILRALGK